MNEELNNILYLTRAHNIYMSNRIDLIASNALTSNFTRFIMGSSLPNSYCIGLPGARLYGGCTYIDMIERAVHDLVRKVFGNMKHVVVQYISGMQANMGAYHAILQPGDTIIAATTKHGGHYSHTSTGPLRFYSPNIIPIPFDEKTYNIDLNALETTVKQAKPKLLILGWSEFLFPHPLEEVRKICDLYNVRLLYDMSHVIGLIAGGIFQQEAPRFADIITSSTGKSLHSADHGLLMFNDDELRPKVLESVMPLLTSNTHPHEVAALGIALSEMIHFGKEYAQQVVANAKALGAALDKEGLKVLYGDLGYTQSHTILLETPMASSAVTLLDRAGILTNACQLPWDEGDAATGIRIGTQVITRHGLKVKDMPRIAKIISEILVKKSEPEVVYFKTVQPYASNFKKVEYSFDSVFPEGIDWFERLLRLYSVDSIAAVLASNQAFANCSMDEIKSIEKYFKLIKYEKLALIFKGGSEADAVFFVANGTVDIVDEADVGKTVIVRQAEGTHFGELGVMTGNKRKYAARAGIKTSLLKIAKDDFLTILANFQTIKKHFDRYIVSFDAPVVVSFEGK